MSPIVFTNKTFIELILQVLAAHGLPWIIGIGILMFVCTITYQILKRKGIIGNPPAPKLDLSPLISEMSKVNSTLKSNGKILDLLVERQTGYLTEDQSRYVLDSLIDSLINSMLKKVMETYTANNIEKHEQIIRKSLSSEIESMIRDNHRELDLIPNLMNYTKPLIEQIKIVPEIIERIIPVIKYEKVEREAARKFKSIISTSIKNKGLI